MKIINILPAILVSVMLTTGVKAQDEEPTGLPGDNFSLQGALEMFKKAANPGEFEKLLNTKSNGVNNLDLNGDGNIDYIRVVNKKDGNTSIFVLQALVSKDESQDVAVIELEKTGDDQAVIQIVGDEDIFGVPTIIEPSEGDATAFNYAPAAHGPNAEMNTAGIVVNVWFWPSVRFVFAPTYSIWVSPWGWYDYPTWWRPWRPLGWAYYRPYRYRYAPRYVVCHTYRVHRAPVIYHPIRRTSVIVRTRNEVVVSNYRTQHNYDPRHVSGPRRFDTNNRTTNVNGRSDINRSTTTVNGARRDVNRTNTNVQGPRGGEWNRNRTEVDGPRRDVNRTNTNVQGPRGGEWNRTRTEVDGPRRDINRTNTNVERPNGREVNRTRTQIEGPRGGEINRTRTQVERPSGREVNRTRTEVQRPSPAPSQRPTFQQQAPRREMNRGNNNNSRRRS